MAVCSRFRQAESIQHQQLDCRHWLVPVHGKLLRAEAGRPPALPFSESMYWDILPPCST